MKQNLPRKLSCFFVCLVGKLSLHARIVGNPRPKKYLCKTRRIWPITVRITRLPAVNSDLY